jgi:hypothetical protein
MYKGNWKYAIGQPTICPGATGVEKRDIREGGGQSEDFLSEDVNFSCPVISDS